MHTERTPLGPLDFLSAAGLGTSGSAGFEGEGTAKTKRTIALPLWEG